MQANYQGGPVFGYGPTQCVARARFQCAGASAGAQTLLDNFGIKSIVRGASAGLFTVTLSDKLPEFTPIVNGVEAGARLHNYAITAIDTTAGTFTFQHRASSAAGFGVAGTADDGLVGTDLVTFQVIVLGRMTL